MQYTKPRGGNPAAHKIAQSDPWLKSQVSTSVSSAMKHTDKPANTYGGRRYRCCSSRPPFHFVSGDPGVQAQAEGQDEEKTFRSSVPPYSSLAVWAAHLIAQLRT